METLINNKPKIIATLVILIIAIVMLVTASMAWFSISTNPEISSMQVGIKAPDRLLLSKDNETWGEYLDLSEEFKYYAPLKPVSTVDGLHWFLPTYKTSGALKKVSEFELDDNLTYANKVIYVDTPSGKEKLTGAELREIEEKAYYVYGDFFIKTEEDLAEVRLSFPNQYARENIGPNEKDGTYLLPSFAIKNNGETDELVDVSNNAESAARIGLLFNPHYDETDCISNPYYGKEDFNNGYTDAYKSNSYFIYEPNADIRSSIDKPITEYGKSVDGTETRSEEFRYIIDYDFTGPDNYTENSYYETLPIKKTENGEYQQTRLSPSVLIPQIHSEWDNDSLIESIRKYESKETKTWWTSNDVKYPFGAFLDTEGLYKDLKPKETFGEDKDPGLGTGDPLSLAENEDGTFPYRMEPNYASQVLITLKKDQPVRVRLFVYIEGQDIDCWNDIAAGGFVVNLEFGAYTAESAE